MIVRDAAGVVVDVSDESCTVRSSADRPPTVQIECMVDAVALGLAETITWTVELHRAPVWTSPPVGTRCSEEDAPEQTEVIQPQPIDEHPVGEVDAPEAPHPVEPAPTTDEVPVVAPAVKAPTAEGVGGIVPPIGGITSPEPVPETARPSVAPTPPVGSVAAPTQAGPAAKPLVQEELPLTGSGPRVVCARGGSDGRIRRGIGSEEPAPPASPLMSPGDGAGHWPALRHRHAP